MRTQASVRNGGGFFFFLQFVSACDIFILRHKLNNFLDRCVFFVKIHARFCIPVEEVKVCVAAIRAVFFGAQLWLRTFYFCKERCIC